jgi:hypothetical protein
MHVLNNRFNDPEVRKEFCAMTGTKEADMWPDAEPTYKGRDLRDRTGRITRRHPND